MIDEIAYDDSSMEELKHRANHWHDTALMLKRQRDLAEEEREGWKLRAMKAEVEREAAEAERDAARDKNIELHNRVRTYNNRAKKLGQKQKKNHKLATYAEESNELLRAERDALLVDRDYWKAAWALAVSEAPGVHAECEALRNIILWALGENGEFPKIPWGVLHTPYPFYWWRTEMRKRLDAAMAVQPTTGGGE